MSNPLDILALTAGFAVVAAVMFDVTSSTLSARSAGPMLRHAAGPTWRLMRWLSGGGRRRRVLAATGPLVMVSAIGSWLLLLWIGWFLVFLGDHEAVLVSQSRAPASVLERLYYAGFSVTTLGVGDFVAGGPFWQFLTVLAAFSGFTVLTLSITFVLTLLSAEAEKRAAADYLTAIGATPRGLLGGAGAAPGAGLLLEHAPSLTAALTSLAQKYAAYPMLQYYHATGANASLALRLAALNEALLYVESGIIGDPSEQRRLRPLQRSIASLVGTLDNVYLRSPQTPPPRPSTTLLAHTASSGVALDLQQAANRQQALRGLLRAFVEREGWDWNDIHVEPEPS